MAQIFHRSFNTISRVTIFGAIFFLAFIAWAYGQYVRSSYATGVASAVDQPIPFSHKHHVSGLGIDCRYCHTSVESSPYAGIPPTHTCMNCHQQVWANSPLLQPVHESYKKNKPIPWVRVHNLADFAYFDHSVHVKKGIGCATCHGPVQEMNLTYQYATLHMEWCLDCHRHPEKYVRPQKEVFNMTWKPPTKPDELKSLSEELGISPVLTSPAELGPALVKKYNIKKRTDCSVCHR